jgi:hypothetical protein
MSTCNNSPPKKQTDVVKQLLAKASAAGMLKESLTAQGGRPASSVLHIAAEQGRVDIVCLLL